MGVYGYDFYGPPTKYGATPLVEFDARPFQAIPINYNQILLTWATPTGAWDKMRLVRDPNGYTPRADMGDVLFEMPIAGAPTSYIDISPLTAGSFYYYTIWVRSTGDGLWRRAADTTALAVKNWRYSGRLFELVPMLYREKDGDHATASVYGAGPLERFLRIFGFQLDHIRSEYESLKNVSNPDRVSGGLLPLMTRQYGFGFEQELGMRLARMQAGNAVHIYKLKGTRLGVEALASVLTGWAATVTIGGNLILDQNDSRFAESIGRWGVEVGTAALARIDSPTAGLGQAVPTPAGASTGDIGSGTYALRITATAAGDVQIALLPSSVITSNASWQQGLIPVAGNTTYTFSFYSRADAISRTVKLGTQEFTALGDNAAGIVEAVGEASPAGAWTRQTVTLTTGSNTRFLRLTARVVGMGAAEMHYLSAAQVEAGGAATTYQDARQTRIRFTPERINWITNPSLEVNTTGWNAGTGSTAISRTTDQAKFGGAALRLTSTGVGGQLGAYTDYTASVVPGQVYTISAYFRPNTTLRTARVRLQWDNAIPAVISYSTSAWTQQVAGWENRLSLTAMAPAGAANIRVWVEVFDSVVGEIHDVDGILFEEGAALRDYFDGQSVSNEGEYIWEGTGGNSRTLYYSRRLIKNYRMNARIREFLPAGSSYKLLYSAV